MREGPKTKMVCPGCGGNVPVRVRGTMTRGCVRETVHSMGYCPACDRHVERTQHYDPKKGGKFVSEETHFFRRRKPAEAAK